MATITGANSVLTLTVQGLFPAPVTIQGFAVDDSFRSEAVTQVETLMGVDGVLSRGFVYNPYPMTIIVQADSNSIQFFESIRVNQEGLQDSFRVDGTIFLPSINTQYSLINGALTSSKAFPDVKKLLQPLEYQFIWQSITSEPSAL